MSNTLWVEKYRPSNLDTYIGNEHLKSKVSMYLESGDLPHLLLYGKAGTGKTTLAKILVKNIECDYLYILRVETYHTFYYMGKPVQVKPLSLKY